jgi:hypothetical protein
VDATNLNKENPENAACKSGIFFFIFTRQSFSEGWMLRNYELRSFCFHSLIF